jgi:hypothetical protein
MADSQPDYHQWTEDGLVIDVQVPTFDGEPEVRRVTISKDRLAYVLGSDPDVARFFLQKVVGGIRKKAPALDPSLMRNVRNLTREIQNPRSPLVRPTKTDELMGPELLRLEALLGTGPKGKQVKIKGYRLPVGRPE